MVIAVALIALAALLVPLTPAHATYGSPLPLSLLADSTDGRTVLARAQGELQFDDGGTKYRFTIAVCKHPGAYYPEPRITLYTNGAVTENLSFSGGATVSWCPYSATIHTREIQYGGIVRNVSMLLEAVTFGGSQGQLLTFRDTLFWDNPYT